MVAGSALTLVLRCCHAGEAQEGKKQGGAEHGVWRTRRGEAGEVGAGIGLQSI